MARRKKTTEEQVKEDVAVLEGKAPEPDVYFESRLGEGIQSIYGTVAQMKAKGVPGALKYGVTGGHIIIAEILDNATDPMAYLTIAAYAVATAMIAAGHWDL